MRTLKSLLACLIAGGFYLITWAVQFMFNHMFEKNASFGEVAGVLAIIIVAKLGVEVADQL